MIDRKGTPEHYLVVTAPASNGDGLDVEALTCALSRASVLCRLLIESEHLADYMNVCECESGGVLSDGLWAIDGALEQAKAMAKGAPTQ